MSLTAADIIAIIQAGGAVDIQADGSISITPAASKRKAGNAERCRRYRMSKHVETMSDHVENVSKHVATCSPSPSLAPSPLSPLHPPIPAPPHPPTPEPSPRIREAGKGSKRQRVETDIAGADREPIPLELQTAAFRDLWDDWCLHRAELYRRNDRKPWTALAARKTLSECARHGPELAVMAMTAAIGNGWQGLFWDRLQVAGATQTNRYGRPEDKVSHTGKENGFDF